MNICMYLFKNKQKRLVDNLIPNSNLLPTAETKKKVKTKLSAEN